MADRVHPMPPSPPRHPASPPAKDRDQDATETTPLHPAAAFHRPPPAPKPAYIVQIPKDQVLRVPPPDRARRYKNLSARPARRRRLRRACCSACAALVLLLLAAAAFLGTVCLVFRPKPPSFSVSSLNLRGLNSSDSDPRLVSGSVLVRADNGGNRKVTVEYLSGGEVDLSYDAGSPLAAGPWPAFRQAPGNVTAFTVAMATTGASFGGEERRKPMAVEARVPVRLRFGKTLLRTWTVDVKATCEVTVDALAGGEVASPASARSRGCRVKVRPFLWWWW